jgi:hypothetical protein
MCCGSLELIDHSYREILDEGGQAVAVFNQPCRFGSNALRPFGEARMIQQRIADEIGQHQSRDHGGRRSAAIASSIRRGSVGSRHLPCCPHT